MFNAVIILGIMLQRILLFIKPPKTEENFTQILVMDSLKYMEKKQKRMEQEAENIYDHKQIRKQNKPQNIKSMYIFKMAFIFLSNVYHPFLFQIFATNQSSLQMVSNERNK